MEKVESIKLHGRIFHMGIVDGKHLSICAHAFQKLFDVGHFQMKTMKEQYFNENIAIVPQHGNKNNKAEMMEGVYSALHDFFQTLKTEGEPHASRQVRAALGTQHLREDEDNTLLAPCWSKRKIFERFLWESGYVPPPVKGDGNYGSIKKFKLRPHDEYCFPAGTERGSICCNRTFRLFWAREYPDVKIGLRAKDTCSLCWEFKLKIDHLYAMKKKKEELTQEQQENNQNNEIQALMTSMNGEIHEGINDFDFAQEHLKVMEELAEHVHEFKVQREYAIQKEKDAKEDTENKVSWENRRFCLTGDYSQNLGLPHFGANQPGDTYYYSPLGVFIFGLADQATLKDILSAYIYTEGEGKKGGNNVCSLIWKKLVDDGIVENAEKYGAPAKELCLVFDNCAGQNKNRMVLRFGQFLVDRDIFCRVEIVFLIVGHTKNICDRRFKDLKNNFHPKQVYTMEKLVEEVKKGRNDEENELLDINRVTGEDFYDYDSYFDTYYKRPDGISKRHIFVFDKSFNGVMKMKRTVVSNDEKPILLPKWPRNANENQKQEWLQSLLSNSPEKEPPVELPDIKKVELYTKWRPHVPPLYKNIICPKPPDEVLDKIKAQRNQKSRNRSASTRKRKRDEITPAPEENVNVDVTQEMSVAEAEGYIQTRVAKKFEDGKIYFGNVTSYDKEEKYWRVVYDDTDSEEFDFYDLKCAILLNERLE